MIGFGGVHTAAGVVVVSFDVSVELNQTAHRAKVSFVLEEQGLKRSLGPVVHGVREQFH